MRRALCGFGIALLLATAGAVCARAQSDTFSSLPGQAVAGNGSAGAQAVDGIAARIEDDIITESEIRELGAFQQLVDGKSKTRAELINELADQWIVHGEAAAAKFPEPSAADVDHSYAELVNQFPSREEFQKRCAEASLTDEAVHRLLKQQLFLSHFIDYRFRPAAQVNDEQIQAYYRDEFAPQLKARGQAVPPAEDVEDTIREVLIQRAITDRATKWLDDTRQRLRIDVVSPGSTP